MWFLDFHPKKYKGVNFDEDWPYRPRVKTISLDTENKKRRASVKKGPKIT